MTVFHGSNVVVDHPDVRHSFRDLDFGRGFYVTTVRIQAERCFVGERRETFSEHI